MNELQINAGIAYAKGALQARAGAAINVTVADGLNKFLHEPQTIGTSKESLATGDVDLTVDAWLFLRNLDATNYVHVWTADQQPPNSKMFPGETFGPIRICGGQIASISLQAHTAACDVEVLLVSAGTPS